MGKGMKAKYPIMRTRQEKFGLKEKIINTEVITNLKILIGTHGNDVESFIKQLV